MEVNMNTIEIYECSHCGFQYHEAKLMANHEEDCECNPANKTWITCQFDEPNRTLKPGILEDKLLMSIATHPDCPLLKSIPGIDATVKIDGHVKGCPHWKEYVLNW
jgi:hypothetical protein